MRTYDGAPEKIRIEMIRCGYTMERLSEVTDISMQVIRGILAGRATISTRNTAALARAFGYSMADFIDLLSGVSSPTHR